MSKTMTLKPRMSEKSYAQSHAENTYTFDVPLETNKVEIAKAVEAQYSVSVKTVRISILKGKNARSIRIGGTRKNVAGKRKDVKKAYVTVKKGENIPIFAAIDEAEKKQEKLEEKIAKTEKKKAEKTVKSEKAVKSDKPKSTVQRTKKVEDKPVEDDEKPKGRLSLRGFMRKKGKDK